MLYIKQFKEIRKEAIKRFPWLTDITYEPFVDRMEIVVLKANSDQPSSVRESHNHLFVEKGYYKCNQDSDEAPQVFYGLLDDTKDPSDFKDIFDTFYIEKNPIHLNEFLSLLGEYGCYPEYLDFTYPYCRVAAIIGEDESFPVVLEKIKITPSDSPKWIANKANLIIGRKSKDKLGFSDSGFQNKWLYFSTREKLMEFITDYSSDFPHLDNKKKKSNFFLVVYDGLEISIVAGEWDYKKELKKYKNNELPYGPF